MKNGFKFEVVGMNIIGEVDGLTREGIWNVIWSKDGYVFSRHDVYESTIKENLDMGIYVEVK